MANPHRGSELLIVDNSDENWKAQQYLHDWCEIARAFDIATGYFEIGSLLALDGQWQKLEHLRILMGDEVSKRTKKAFEEGLAQIMGRLDDSIEAAKEEDDFLSGVPAIVEAIGSGKIQARVYRKRKFHAKAYITHAKLDVVGAAALVGSSNFTYPGLHDNVESAVSKAVKEATQKVQLEAKNREALLKKEFDGERNVLATRIEALEQTVREQNERIARLTQQAEKAYSQVQDIAVTAIEGTSRSQSLSNLQQLMAEQTRKQAQEE